MWGPMSRYSRFENLENERPREDRPREDAESSPLKDRFADQPPPSTAPTIDAKPPPVVAAPQVAPRFGEDGLRTFEDELSRLPTLECAACGTEASKFDVACHRCGARLDTGLARAHNLKRLQAYEEARHAEATKAAELRDHEIRSLAERRAQAEAAADAIIAEHRAQIPASTKVIWGLILLFGTLAWLAPPFWPKLVFSGLTLLLLMTRLPPGAWAVLGRHWTRGPGSGWF